MYETANIYIITSRANSGTAVLTRQDSGMLVDWAEQNANKPIDENKVRSSCSRLPLEQRLRPRELLGMYFGSYESTKNPTVEENNAGVSRLGRCAD